jgi:RNA polymerase sigma-70 factor, ECF subfamily
MISNSVRHEENQVTNNSIPAVQAPLDPSLVARAQQGDPEAFAALFNAHKARIYFLCLRMTNDAAEAEDLTQDTFMHVFRKLSTFRGDSALSTWLHRVAVNTVLMHFRKKTLPQVSLDEPIRQSEDGRTLRPEYGTRDGRLNCCVDLVALDRAIQDLPPGYRNIFMLHEVEGYEHREIAALLGCSPGNSKSQLHKAKLRIREFIASQEPRTEKQAKKRAVRAKRPVVVVPAPMVAKARTTAMPRIPAGALVASTGQFVGVGA